MVKGCISELAPVITRIINLLLVQSSFPDKYKRAVVKPLLKKTGLDPVFKNCRPVSNLCFGSKVIEDAVSLQIQEHIHRHGYFEKLQSAYRSKHSTETALIKVLIKDDVLISLDDNDVVFLSLLDLSAAFDTVDHVTLIERLRCSFGISGSALEWIRSYLTGRSTAVLIDGKYSNDRVLTCSVPQSISPRIYRDYTLPLGKLLRFFLVMYHLYADDTQMHK